RKRFCS
ncbi:ABC transporter periplasmic oligopeptide binding lipocomponent domain protein, partial [Chlamydia psittaci 84-8471/1]